MKTNTTQQEILLFTGTSFSSRQCYKCDDSGNSRNLSEKEMLEEACWNGLIKEMLPEICEQSAKARMLTLWEVREGASFLELDLGEFPTVKEKYFSIDPYSFLQTQLLS